MSTLYKVNRRHQVTIPKDIREKIDLHIGDYILIDLAGDEIRLRPVKERQKTHSQPSRSFWEDIDRGAPLSVTEEEIVQEVRAYRAQHRG
jgi:AbrB family looped-hinge helix DNA binding protein